MSMFPVIHQEPTRDVFPCLHGPESLEFRALQVLSAKVGCDPLLTQGSSGNASLKIGGTLWIKASGTWLADAETDQIFLPVDLELARRHLGESRSLSDFGNGESRNGPSLRPSVETAMHVALPHTVVLHVHSVNTIAAAVRCDAPRMLAERLAGLPWAWVRYVDSGQPLGVAIKAVCARRPDAKIFVLGNHGLVVCGESSSDVECLLQQVEARLRTCPRRIVSWDLAYLRDVANRSGWLLPRSPEIHLLGTDPIAQTILASGVLYPCQSIFLHGSNPWLQASEVDGSLGQQRPWPFLILRGKGVLISQTMSDAEYETLAGLGEVVRRLGSCSSIRYLSASELPQCGGPYRSTARAARFQSAVAKPAGILPTKKAANHED